MKTAEQLRQQTKAVYAQVRGEVRELLAKYGILHNPDKPGAGVSDGEIIDQLRQALDITITPSRNEAIEEETSWPEANMALNMLTHQLLLILQRSDRPTHKADPNQPYYEWLINELEIALEERAIVPTDTDKLP